MIGSSISRSAQTPELVPVPTRVTDWLREWARPTTLFKMALRARLSQDDSYVRICAWPALKPTGRVIECTRNLECVPLGDD